MADFELFCRGYGYGNIAVYFLFFCQNGKQSHNNPDLDCMFLGLLDPDPLVIGTNPAPDPHPSIIKQKYYEKNFISTVL
jgi:hypothetical protein